MERQNCWDFKRCGREPHGARSDELGVRPAAAESGVNGINGGRNWGRACWLLAGTFCGGKVQGSFAAKLGDRRVCEFYRLVVEEQGLDYLRAAAVPATPASGQPA